LKVKIYKTTERPIIIYAAEARPDTNRTLQMMRKVEMKTLRSYKAELYTIEYEDEIRIQCGIQDIGRSVRHRRRFLRQTCEENGGQQSRQTLN